MPAPVKGLRRGQPRPHPVPMPSRLRISRLAGCAHGRERAVVIFTLIALIAATGCSADDTQGAAVGKAFAARALSVCTAAQESKADWSLFPVSDFDPQQPDASQFPEVGAWLESEVSPTFEAWRDDLTALGNPPSGPRPWADVLSAVAAIADLNAAQVEAAKAADVDAFADATKGLQDAQPKLERATAAAGVAECAEVHAG